MMNMVQKVFLCVSFLLLTADSFSQVLPEKKPDLWKQAEVLVQKREWRKAEQLFQKMLSSGQNAKRKDLCRYQIAFCREQNGEKKMARQQYEALVSDLSAYRNAPDAVRMASVRLHALLLEDPNASARRQRLIQDFLRRFPDAGKEAGTLCAAEAHCRLRQNRVEEALPYYRSAAGNGVQKLEPLLALLSPGRSGPVTNKDLQNLSILEKTFPELLAPVCKWLSLRQDGWKAECLGIMAQVRSGKTKDALLQLDKLIRTRKGPEDALLLLKIEIKAMNTGSRRECIGEFKNWLRRFEHSIFRDKAEFQYGELLMRCNLYAEAVEQFEVVRKKYPESSYCKLAEEQLVLAEKRAAEAEKQKKQQSEKKQQQAQDPLLAVYERAQKLQKEKKFALASAEYQRFRGRKDHPQWGHAWREMGVCLRETGETRAALAAWNEVYRHFQVHKKTLLSASALWLTAETLLEEEADSAAALRAYEEAKRLDPEGGKHDKIRMNRAFCLLLTGRREEGKQFFREKYNAAEAGSFDQFYWKQLLDLCERFPFQQQKVSLPSDRKTRTRMMTGDFYFQNGNYKKARRQYEICSKTAADPEMAAYCLHQTARCLGKERKTDAALQTYEKLLRKYPQSKVAPGALMRAGVLWMGPKDNPKRSMETFYRVFTEYPQDFYAPYALFYIATCAGWTDDFQKSEFFYREVLKHYPASDLCPVIREKYLPMVEPKK